MGEHLNSGRCLHSVSLFYTQGQHPGVHPSTAVGAAPHQPKDIQRQRATPKVDSGRSDYICGHALQQEELRIPENATPMAPQSRHPTRPLGLTEERDQNCPRRLTLSVEGSQTSMHICCDWPMSSTMPTDNQKQS